MRADLFFLLCSTALIAPLAALGQVAVPAGTPPTSYTLDANGVDLATGTFNISHTDITIGPAGAGGLNYGESEGSAYGNRPNTEFDFTFSGPNTFVSIGGVSDSFTGSSGTGYVNALGRGSQLTLLKGSQPQYQYTSVDGTVATFAPTFPLRTTGTIVKPTGEIITYYYAGFGYLDSSGNAQYAHRVQGLTSNRGYALKFDYYSNTTLGAAYAAAYEQLVAVSAVNITQTACDVTADATCSGMPGVRTTSYANGAGIRTVTNPLNQTTTYRYDGYGRLSGFRLPASSIDDVAVTYDGNGRVQYIDRPTGRWTYSFTVSASNVVTQATVIDPTNVSSTMVFDPTVNKPTSVTAAGRTTGYTYDGFGRVLTTTAPEQNSVTYEYDARGNIDKVTRTPVPSAHSSPPIVTRASFPASCTSPITAATCNKPTATFDALNSETDYVYNGNGTVASVTSPKGSNGVRPQVRYAYAPITTSYWQRFTYNDFHQAAGPAIAVLSTTSACQNGTACTGGVDEVRTTVGYGADTNALPTTIAVAAGDNSLSAAATLAYTYDGDVTSSTGPLASMVTRTYYDGMRRPVRVIGADPDGGGPLLNPTTYTVYDGDGRPTSVQQGTSTSQTDSGGASFVALATRTNSYDPATGQLIQTTTAGSATASTVSYGYDAANRPLTTIVAMQGQGADRETRNGYDGNGLLSTVTTAYGQAEAATITYGYANGRLSSHQDGNHNTTSYAYDDQGRPQKTTYADGSSETLIYDLNSNVVQCTLRDNQVLAYAYDLLNRVTSRSGTGLANAYVYDNLGRLTSATGGSYNVARTYDALGNMLTDTTGGYSMYNTYDIAGRRTCEHWGSACTNTGAQFFFDYLANGTLQDIKDSSGYIYAGFTYDDLGRRTNLTYVNGRSTSYTYGADLRLASLTNHMGGGAGSGTANDVQYGYQYNPAGQIVARTISNDSYVYQPTTRSVGVTPNALNQPGPQPSPFTYDQRGNQTAVAGTPARSAAWRIDDKPLSVALGGKSPDILQYDALDRLAGVQVGTGGAVTRLVWDGDELAGELDSTGALQIIYAHDQGNGAPVVMRNWPGHYNLAFHTDERGSVVAVSGSTVAYDDGPGTVQRIHLYDSYGREGSAAHLGRFGYAGGIALP